MNVRMEERRNDVGASIELWGTPTFITIAVVDIDSDRSTSVREIADDARALLRLKFIKREFV